MNNAITLRGLLLVLGAIVGFLTLAFGILRFMAGGMSDAPQLGDDEGRAGCITAVVGLAILVGSIVALLA